MGTEWRTIPQNNGRIIDETHTWDRPEALAHYRELFRRVLWKGGGCNSPHHIGQVTPRFWFTRKVDLIQMAILGYGFCWEEAAG